MKKLLQLLVLAGTFLVGLMLSPMLFHQTDAGISAAANPSQSAPSATQPAAALTATEKPNSFSVNRLAGLKAGEINAPSVMIERGQRYLLQQVSNRINQLQPLQARLAQMTTLKPADRDSLTGEIKAEIEAFKSLQEQVKHSSTHQDIRNVAGQIKAEWLKSRRSVDRAHGLIMVSKGSVALAEADAASAGLQKRVDQLKASGKDAKRIEKLMAQYGKKLSSARSDMQAAQGKWDSASGQPLSESARKKHKKQNELLLAKSQDELRGAYKLLKNAAREEFSKRYR